MLRAGERREKEFVKPRPGNLLYSQLHNNIVTFKELYRGAGGDQIVFVFNFGQKKQNLNLTNRSLDSAKHEEEAEDGQK